MSNWTHKVVKKARGNDGKFFDFPTAGTFKSFEAACEYAETFAREQGAAHVSAVKICVRPRRGDGEGKVYSTDDYYVPVGKSA